MTAIDILEHMQRTGLCSKHITFIGSLCPPRSRFCDYPLTDEAPKAQDVSNLLKEKERARGKVRNPTNGEGGET